MHAWLENVCYDAEAVHDSKHGPMVWAELAYLRTAAHKGERSLFTFPVKLNQLRFLLGRGTAPKLS